MSPPPKLAYLAYLMKHWWSLDALVTCLCQVLCDAKQVPGPVTLSCLIRGFVTVFFLINAKHTVDTLSINSFSLAEQKSRIVKVKWVYSKRAAHYCTLSQMCISSQGDALSEANLEYKYEDSNIGGSSTLTFSQIPNCWSQMLTIVVRCIKIQ